MNICLFYPGYIQILNHQANGWFHDSDSNLLKINDREFDWLNREKYFGLTKQQILVELFRRYEGKLGYYLVHFPNREYYYCGMELKSVRSLLQSIGITQPELLSHYG